MKLIIDLRRKRVKIEFEATQEEMGEGDTAVNVEVKMNKRQNTGIQAQIPSITGKLLHYLIMTNVVLLGSTYEKITEQIQTALESEKTNDGKSV